MGDFVFHGEENGMELRIEKVSKIYDGRTWALRDFSLEVRPGVLGLLGPNGAGKTTLMSILATITLPSQGRVTWDGRDIVAQPDAVRTVLGYLPQDFGVYPHLNAVEFLEYMAALKGLGRGKRAAEGRAQFSAAAARRTEADV